MFNKKKSSVTENLSFPNVRFNLTSKGKIECITSESGAKAWVNAGMFFSTALALHLLDVKHLTDERYKAKILIDNDDVLEITPAFPKEEGGPIIKWKKIYFPLEEILYKELPGWLWVKVFRALINEFSTSLIDVYNASIEAASKDQMSNNATSDGEGEEISPDDPDFC